MSWPNASPRLTNSGFLPHLYATATLQEDLAQFVQVAHPPCPLSSRAFPCPIPRGLFSFVDTRIPKLRALYDYVRELTRCHNCLRKVSLKVRKTHCEPHRRPRVSSVEEVQVVANVYQLLDEPGPNEGRRDAGLQETGQARAAPEKGLEPEPPPMPEHHPPKGHYVPQFQVRCTGGHRSDYQRLW